MVHSAVAEDTPFPKTQGTPKSSVGGTPGWNPVPSARKDGWPPGLDRSVRRDFRPGQSPASRESGVAKPMTKPSSRSAGVGVWLSIAWPASQCC